MNRYCYGCGVLLQDTNKNKEGFVKKIDDRENLLCYRCFRMQHHNEYHSHYLDLNHFKKIVKDTILRNHLVILVVDLFDLNSCFSDDLIKIIKNNPILIVATKRDIVLKSVKDLKIKQYLKKLGLEHDLNIKDIVITSAIKKYNIDNLLDKIYEYSNNKDAYLVGITNVGKSSLVNALLNSVEKNNANITVTNYPGTTLDVIQIPIDDDTYLCDTPGIVNEDQIIHYLDIKDYDYLKLDKEIKCRTYQLNEAQTLYIGGLASFSFVSGEKTGFSAYFPNNLNIHRTKYENSFDLYDLHQEDDVLIPRLNDIKMISDMKVYKFKIDTNEKVDIFISGLGWICFIGNNQEIEVRVHHKNKVILRDALI